MGRPLRFAMSLAMLLSLASTGHARSVSIIDINPDTQVAENPGPGQWFGFDEGFLADTMLGWTFHINQNLVVKQLGYYDRNGDGLLMPHSVDLWQDLSGGYFLPGSTSPTLLSRLTIPNGTTASLSGVWRVIDLPEPLTLVPGDYQLVTHQPVASTQTDVVKYVLAHPDNGPSNEYVTIRAFIWNVFGSTAPVDQSHFYLANGMELGPMLFADQIPEPATSVMPWTAALTAMASRLRRHRRCLQPSAK